jgi:hypothetical protein
MVFAGTILVIKYEGISKTNKQTKTVPIFSKAM